MKSKYLKRILGAAIIALTLVFGFGISSMTTAQAQTPWDDYQYRRQQEEYRRRQEEQYRRDQGRREQDDRWRDQDRWGRNQDRWDRGRNWDGYPNWGGGYELRQTALNAGYNEGVRQGRADRNRRHGYYGGDFRSNGSYRNATKDYNSRFGDRELYRRYFQMAYENGYADGLRGY